MRGKTCQKRCLASGFNGRHSFEGTKKNGRIFMSVAMRAPAMALTIQHAPIMCPTGSPYACSYLRTHGCVSFGNQH